MVSERVHDGRVKTAGQAGLISLTQIEILENSLEIAVLKFSKSVSSDILPPIRPHLLSLPQGVPPNISMPGTMGDIFYSSNTYRFF